MKKLFMLSIVVLVSCISELPTSPELKVDFELFENITHPLCDSTKLFMDGVYEVLQGKEIFGSEVVCKWFDKRLSIISTHDVIYSENVGGAVADTIAFTGYFRTVRSANAARMSLLIYPENGGQALVSRIAPNIVTLAGKTSDGCPLLFKKKRNLYGGNRDFQIIAHRGGGRNSERLGFSENSIEMIKHCKVLGSTGIEIDVKLTRDGHAIIFHDNTFSPRTVNGSYLLGKVDNFDLHHIKLFGRLVCGEQIPTLSEALTAIIEDTKLTMVWLDVKDVNVVDEIIRVQSESINYAKSLGRDIQILLGIPDKKVLEAYKNSKLTNTTPILIELDLSIALSDDFPTCEVWAPRWTNGFQNSKVELAKNAGMKVFIWTLDVKDCIYDFINNSNVDGILSNYPSLVAGIYYSQNK
ncbi:MAG: hypothetical protein CVV22_05730 [Ignavibacteriae bacterium HGW-Ignavibacteriae-1]|jgi:glycerophosphoryl diester phosphodiesterase|nr:MAG: hypothetical protein CVV22_05730 [Ignavibacteriae bacterium HGW-Ignavibacteriae-1]